MIETIAKTVLTKQMQDALWIYLNHFDEIHVFGPAAPGTIDN